MKRTLRQFTNALLVGLVMISATGNAQSIDNGADSAIGEKPFDVAAYMGANRTINLMLAVYRVKGVTLVLKDAHDTILYELYLKKSPKAYHHKLNFEGCRSGVYQLEISDGQQKVIRRIDVVDIPAIDSQRYVTFTSQTNL